MEKCPFCLKNEVSKTLLNACCDNEECAKDMLNYRDEMLQMADNENQHHALLDQLELAQEEAV